MNQREHLRRWWGPGEFTRPEAEVDLRPGGAYRLVM
ncbi:MAG: SRPBCC domain-containing protein [Actinomycetota bacterium]|nr:SRPBCC domain-containing protein [Actinomycetota bacterium]